jgi:hypothetical protein
MNGKMGTERIYIMENNLNFYKQVFNSKKFCLPSTHYLFEMKVEFFSPASNDSDFP